MTREKFIKKWLGNKDYQYTEQNRDLMRDDLDEVINQAFRQPPVSGSSLSEAILIMENLMAYGRIHTVKGVRYVEGSHEEILDKAEEWLNKVRKNYR